MVAAEEEEGLHRGALARRVGADGGTSVILRSQVFRRGAILLTGTGVVPPDTFTLQNSDAVRIRVSGIGELANTVISV